MKITLALLLAVALFAVLTRAEPEAEPGKNPIKKVEEAVKNLFNKVCHKNDENVCKKWAKEKITWKNAKKIGRELKPIVKVFCATPAGKTPQMLVPCQIVTRL